MQRLQQGSIMTQIDLTRTGIDKQRSSHLRDLCQQMAHLSDCQKLKFGAVAVLGSRILAKDYNRAIQATKHMCAENCIRKQIPSRIDSMVGGCCHAEELVLWHIMHSNISHEDRASVEIFTLGTDLHGKLLPKTENEFTCLRCATQMVLAGIRSVVIWRTDFKCWVPIPVLSAVRSASNYAVGVLEAENAYDPNQLRISGI